MARRDWHLIADVGGTNARFALLAADSMQIMQKSYYLVADFFRFEELLEQFMATIASCDSWNLQPLSACLAVAGAVRDQEMVRLTNRGWRLSATELRQTLDCDVTLVNDFAALGQAIPTLNQSDWRQFGGGEGESGQAVAVLGPGTGLGVCSLVSFQGRYQVLPGEGGHVDFAPVNDEEIELLRVLKREFGRVSAEQLLSGAGLVNIYRGISQVHGKTVAPRVPAAITEAALNGGDDVAVTSLQVFSRLLGSFAGNLALTLGARGGVYIAGGIAPRIVDFLAKSEMRLRFEAKGRFQSYLAPIPLRVVCRQDLGLEGAAALVSSRRLTATF